MIQTIFILFIYATISSLGLTLIKMSMNNSEIVSLNDLSLLISGWRFWAGTLLYGFGFIIWLVLMKLNNLSTIFPSAAGSIVVATTILSFYYLEENITIKIILGILLIIAGIYIVTSK